jgi:GAF domain-containing protein
MKQADSDSIVDEDKRVLAAIADPKIKKKVENFLSRHGRSSAEFIPNARDVLNHLQSSRYDLLMLHETELEHAVDLAFQCVQSRREREMLEKLHQLSIAINSATELNEILKLTCKAAVEIFNVDHSGVVLFEKNLRKGKVIAEYPARKHFVETEIPVKGIPLEERLVYHQEIINIADFSCCDSLGPVGKTLIGFNIRSVLIVPVVLNGRVIASFSLDMFTRNREFYPDEIELCKKFAVQVATAMGSARSMEELSVINQIGHDIGQAAPTRLDVKRILEIVKTHAGKLMDVSNFYTALYDEETGRYTFPIHIDEQDNLAAIETGRLDRGLTGYVRRTRQPLRADETKTRQLMALGEIEIVGAPSRVWLGAPLIARNNVLGVMAVQNYESSGTYDENDLLLLQTIASHAAIAIDNVRLFERIQGQHYNQIKAVRRISDSIADSTHQEEMLRGILEWAASLINNAHLAEILILDTRTSELKVIATHGMDIDHQYRRLPAGKGITGWVAQKKQSVLAADVTRDNRYLSVSRATRSEIAVPLLKEQELLGVLNIEHQRPHAFNRDHLALAEAIAGLTVVAMENARLYEDLDHKIKDLENANKRIADTQELVTRTAIAADFIHRINNLAGTIPPRIGMAMEHLDAQDPRDCAVIKQLTAINGHSRSLLMAARQIKQAGKKQAAEHLAVNELVELAVNKIKGVIPINEKQIRIETQLSDNLEVICAQRNKLLDMLDNILSNAVEAIARTGRLCLCTGSGQLGDQPCIDIGISDNGMGIPPENLPRIFDPYFTTRENGLGFGLWRDKTFIKELGGDIEVKSSVGEGSTFTIKIPTNGSARAAGA